MDEKLISLSIGQLFTTIGGNAKYSLKYISEHSGEYPVYSAKTTGDMIKGNIDTYDYDVECLQITSDGAKAGTIIYRNKTKFSVGPATRIYQLKKEYENEILLKFLYYSLLHSPKMKDFSWTNKAGITKLATLTIDIPVGADGRFDKPVQEAIVEKYERIEARKQDLEKQLTALKTVEVDCMDKNVYKTLFIRVADLFDLSIGTNGSKFTKTFIKENPGTIPVYGASADSSPSYGYVADEAKIIEKEQQIPVRYFQDCLTYNIDGLAGYIFYRKGKFSLSEKVRPLVIQKEYQCCINPLYVKYILEPIFRGNVKGRKGENGTNEYTKLNNSMIKDLLVPFPSNDAGNPDINVQNRIVEKYNLIATMKQKIEDMGHQFMESNLNFDANGLPYIYIYITIGSLFDLQRGLSKYTKVYCRKHAGNYPVYSANNKLPLGYRDHFDYTGPHLTVSVNGIAGKITVLDGQFSLNADRMILLPKIENLNLNYIANILEPRLREKTKGRKAENGKNEYTKIDKHAILETQIPIPFNYQGEVDLAIQEQVAKKNQAVAGMKEQLDYLVHTLLAVEIQI